MSTKANETVTVNTGGATLRGQDAAASELWIQSRSVTTDYYGQVLGNAGVTVTVQPAMTENHFNTAKPSK